ncbi:MAG TPA: helix-turn-helix domain-containing protein [Tepidisphaeraceae bacterium]|jgi:AraC-like DNA-binding protein|nr:helix-turn-helix domain-containing protein [Tepidisphaeraceae bacterium]
MAFTATQTISQDDVALSGRRPVRVQWLDVPSVVARHDHAYHEICLIVVGEAWHETAMGQTRVAAGQVIVVPPPGVHAIRPITDTSVINVYYLAEWLAADLALLWTEPGLVELFLANSVIGMQGNPDVVEFALTPAERAAIEVDLRDIDGEEAAAATQNTLVRGAFLKVLARLSRAYARTVPSKTPMRAELWKSICHVERLVQTAAPLDVAALAEQVGLSSDYLSKLFRSATGRTISDYFQLRRVHRACQLLMDPSYSVTDIAFILGYSDAPHLCRMFHRHRNMSPMTYRAVYGHHS